MAGCSEADAGVRVVMGYILPLYIYGLALLFLWASYSKANDCCQYKVEAVIVSNEPSPKYWDRCVMTVRYQSPLPEDTRAFLYTMELPGKACATTQDDPQQQGGPGVGKVLQGCVRTREPQHFLSKVEDEQVPDPDDLSSLNTIHNRFVAFLVVIAGAIVLAIVLVDKPTAALPLFLFNSLYGKARSRGKRSFPCTGSHLLAPNNQVLDAAEGKDGKGDPLLGNAVL